MKNIFRIITIVFGVCAAAMFGLLLWQRSINTGLRGKIETSKQEYKREKSQLKHLEKLKASEDLSAQEQGIIACVPVGDMQALTLAKEIRQHVRNLALDNFVFMLGDGPATSAVPKPSPERLDIVPLTVTISFEAQFPQIRSFLEYLYTLKRFINIERLSIARTEATESQAQAGSGSGYPAGMPGIPSGMIQSGAGPGVVPGAAGAVKYIRQKVSIVMTTYTFTR